LPWMPAARLIALVKVTSLFYSSIFWSPNDGDSRTLSFCGRVCCLATHS
jgi:hypothetical protein